MLVHPAPPAPLGYGPFPPALAISASSSAASYPQKHRFSTAMLANTESRCMPHPKKSQENCLRILQFDEQIAIGVVVKLELPAQLLLEHFEHLTSRHIFFSQMIGK